MRVIDKKNQSKKKIGVGKLVNISIFLFTSLICVFCSELIMRKFLNFSQGTSITYYVRDEIVPGVRLGKFNATLRQRKNTGDYDVVINFNQYGLRDTRDISKAKKDSFLVVGDSFTFGHGIKAGKRFSDLLFLKYNKDVYNLAIPTGLNGYKSLIKYAEILGAKSKKLILVICMENDLLNFNDEKILNISNLDKKDKKNKIKSFLSTQKSFLMNNSALYYSFTSAIHQNNWLKNFFIKIDLINPSIKTSKFIKKDLYGSAIFIKNLTTKFDSFIVLIPSRYNWAGNQETIIKYRNEHITFRKELEKRGLNVLDLRDKFEAISNNPLVELHFAKDGHWNETANAIAAKEIISFILK